MVLCRTLSPAALSKLKDMVAEHLDNLLYLNDILCLKVHAINEVLTAQVIKKLLVPLYVHSLVPTYALVPADQVRPVPVGRARAAGARCGYVLTQTDGPPCTPGPCVFCVCVCVCAGRRWIISVTRRRSRASHASRPRWLCSC